MSKKETPSASPVPDDAVKAKAPDCGDLAEIVAMLEQAESSRRKQAVVSFVGVIAIAAILVLFLYNLWCWSKAEYDIKNIKQVVTAEVTAFFEDAGTQALIAGTVEDFKGRFIPAYRDAILAQFKAKQPQFEDTLEAQVARIQSTLNDSIRAKMEARLLAAFSKVEQDLLAKYATGAEGAPTTEQMTKALEEFKATFEAEIAEVLEKNIDKAKTEMNNLYATVLQLKESPEYKAIGNSSVEEVESLLLETLLIRCVYEVNADRGDEKVNGGI